MKPLYFIIVLVFICTSCNSNQLSKDFNCKTPNFNNLEVVTDFKKNFTIEIPSNWKTNLYYDDVVSSVYTADTTQNLTKAFIMDVSFVLNPIDIDAAFIQKVATDNSKMELTQMASKEIKFHDKNAYYNLAKGKQGKFSYHVLNVFAKETNGFLHVKTEIYGDSLVNERLCKAIKLIDDIRIK